MQRKLTAIAFFFLFMISATSALANWAMVYGTDNEKDFEFPPGPADLTRFRDYFHDIAASPDGSFIFIGTNATNFNNVDHYKKMGIWFGKITSTGELMWEKEYGFGYGLGITDTSDGNYVAVTAEPPSGLLGFIKIANDGSIIWKKTYQDQKNWDSQRVYLGVRHPFRIKPTLDGGFIFAGFHSTYKETLTGLEFSYNDPWVAKFDADGDFQWEVALSPEPLGDIYDIYRVFYDIVQDINENYIAVGSSSSAGCIAVKLSADGQILWDRAYLDLGPGTSVQESLDTNGDPDGYVFTAYDQTYVTTYSATWAVLKIDRATGDIIWQKKYDLVGYPFGLVTMSDRGLVVAGVTGDTTNQDWAFLRLDSAGQVMDCKVLATEDVYNETIFSLKNTLDGGIVAAGRTDYQMYETAGGDAKLVKLDAQLDIAGCPQLTSIEVTYTAGTITASDLEDSERYETHCPIVNTLPPITIEPLSESMPLCREEANLKFHQQADTPDPVGIGEVVTYTIVLENMGPIDATGVVVNGSVSSGENMVVGWSGDMTQDGLAYTCNVGDLAVGDTETFSIIVTATEAGVMESRATAIGDQYDGWPDNNETFEDTTVEQPGLSVFIQDNPDPTCLACGLSYTVTVTNFSTIDATGVVLTDTLPPEFDPSIYICSLGEAAGLSEGVVTCNIGDLTAGQKATLTLGGTVTAAAAGVLVNTAEITADNVDPLPQHVDTEETAVQYPDLAVEISDWSDPVRVGYYLIYTVTASNLSTFPAQDVTVTDTLPPGTELISCVASQGSCTPGTGTVTAELGGLNGESSAQMTIVLKVLSEGSIVNTAEVSNALGDDTNPADNSDTETTEITTWFKQDLGRFEGEERRPVSLDTDPSGNIWMAFIYGDGHLKVADNTQGYWRITTFSGYVTEAALTVDDRGVVHMAYCLKTKHPTYTIYYWNIYYTHNTGGQWSQPKQVNVEGDNDAPVESLQIEVKLEPEPEPLIYISCIGHHSYWADSHLWYFKSHPEATSGFVEYWQPAMWSVAMAVDDGVNDHGIPHFSYFSQDVLNDESNHVGIGYFNRRYWPEPMYEIVDPGWGCAACEGYFTDIALDSQYRPHIVYAGQENNEGFEPYWHATKNGDTWEYTKLAGGYRYSGGCAVALDAADGVHTVVYDVSESNGKIAYVSKQEDAWETTTIYTSDGRIPLLNPNITVDAKQNVHIAFLDDNFHLQLHSNSLAGDTDLDSVPDAVEMGPNGNDPLWDGNQDGSPDHQQSHVASLKTWDNSGYVTLAAPDHVILADVQAIDNPSPLDCPADQNFSLGWFSFKVLGLSKGEAVQIRLYLPAGSTPLGYHKYGPTAENAQHHWYAFDYDDVTETGAQVAGHVITLNLIDGKRGDSSLAAEGIIVDPGGPAVEIIVEPDADGDEIPDSQDNCPTTANQDQEDGDEDGTGDACDGCPNDPAKTLPGICGCSVPETDTDEDTYPDCVDLWPEDPAEWADNDSDGIGDNADPDDDEDGMPDEWEETYGLDSLANDAFEDADKDGYSNIEEYNLGSDPTNRNDPEPKTMPWLPILLE